MDWTRGKIRCEVFGINDSTGTCLESSITYHNSVSTSEKELEADFVFGGERSEKGVCRDHFYFAIE